MANGQSMFNPHSCLQWFISPDFPAEPFRRTAGFKPQLGAPELQGVLPFNCGRILKAKVGDSCPRKQSCFYDQSVSRQERLRGNWNVDFVARCSPGLWITQYTSPAFSHTRHRPYLPPTFQPRWQFPKHRRFFHPLLTTVIPTGWNGLPSSVSENLLLPPRLNPSIMNPPR